MRKENPEVDAMVMSVQAKVDDCKNNSVFRCTVFALAIAAGYFFSVFAFDALHHVPLMRSQGPTKASMLIEILRSPHPGD